MSSGWFRGCIGLAIGCASMSLAATTQPANKGDDVFATDRLWIIHLRMAAADWQEMQPAEREQSRLAAVLQPATRPTTRPAAKADNPPPPADPRKRSAFGREFAFIRGTVEMDGQTYKNIGIRFKGNASYASAARVLKRPFKLDFNRFDPNQTLHGLTQINLNNNSFDPSMVREALSYEVFRGAGIPSPRTAFALVYLTVEGVHDRECLGVYTLVEEVGNRYLKTHFDSSKGLLLKPERVGGLAYLGEDWPAYEAYGAKTETTPRIQRRFIEFTRLIHKADNDEFRQKIDSYLAVDEFLRFVAANALLSNLDSFLAGGHNYLMYVHPKDERVYFMPWDLHLSLGSWGPINTLEEQTNLSIDRPYLGSSPLTERVLNLEENRKAYHEHVKRMMATCFSPQTLHARIDAMQAVIRQAEQRAKADGKRPQPSGGLGGLGANAPEPKLFVSKRVEYVTAQLEGTKKGFVPNWQAVAAAKARREANGLALPLAAAMFKALHPRKEGGVSEPELRGAIRAFFVQTDISKRGSLDEPTLAEALNDLMPEALGGRRGRNPQRRGIGIEWRWEGPGPFLARAVVREADRDKDKRVSLEELTAAAKQAFVEADDDKDGKLDRDELLDGIVRLCRPRDDR
jgi:hypothetical protein